MVRNYIKKTNRGVGGKYSKETLEEAVANVKAGRYSLKAAAKEYGIPKSTLGLKVNGWRGRPSAGNLNGVAGGGRTALSVEDENKLASRIKIMNKWRFGLSRKEILNTVQTCVKQTHLKTPFRNDRPGEDWFLKFAKRHKLSIKNAELIESSRVRQQRDPFIIYDFFGKLEKVLNDKGLHEHPSKVWNADETSFNYDPKNTKVVTGVGEIAQRQKGGSGRKTTYLENLKAAKKDGKSKKKSTKKKQPKKQVSSDEAESSPIVYAESDDSYELEGEDEDDLEVSTSVQEPNNDNMVVGRYIILRVKKRAVSHCIGILMNREVDYIEVRCLKRCTGYIFEFGSEDCTINQFSYDNIVGILQFPKAINGKLHFSEDLSVFKNIL